MSGICVAAFAGTGIIGGRTLEFKLISGPPTIFTAPAAAEIPTLVFDCTRVSSAESNNIPPGVVSVIPPVGAGAGLPAAIFQPPGSDQQRSVGVGAADCRAAGYAGVVGRERYVVGDESSDDAVFA